MRPLVSIRTPVIGLASALLLFAGSSGAGPLADLQVSISEPPPETVFESSLDALGIDFQVANTGVDEIRVIELKSFSLFTVGLDDEKIREVLRPGSVGRCRSGTEFVTILGVGDRCTVRVSYLILDGDPFDNDKKVDSAKWIAGIDATWMYKDDTEAHSATSRTFVTIKDDPVPEPSTWSMMLAGFAGVGGALRYARRRSGRVCHTS
jgi:hypothetical protein|nr:hypothetical protein [Phenylobacterium sp.]